MSTQCHYLVFSPSFGEPLLSIGFHSDRLFSLPGDPPSITRVTSHIGKTAQGRRKKRQNVHGRGYSLSYRQTTTICALPDDILLDIFGFYKETDVPHRVWNWHLLVHDSCREESGIWPALPIMIDFDYQSDRRGNNDEDNIIAALEHVDRVCDVRLRATDSELKNITTVMQAPFPVLTNLLIDSKDGNAPVFPAEFLGGSAPRLQRIYLDGIPFPALPTLLLSTSSLVALHLLNIPPAGLIPPEAMVVGLAALPKLKTFIIQFRSATPRPDRIHPPPETRTVLPALTFFQLQGASEYLEDLVARIDAPQLNGIHIRYLNQLVDFRVPQLPMFIDRSVGPKLTQCRHAQVTFHSLRVTFRTFHHGGESGVPYRDESDALTDVRCRGIDWQVSHIAHVLKHFSATLPNMVHLWFDGEPPSEGTNDVEWLHLLHQFSTVQTLSVSHGLVEYFALVLESIAFAEALPSLDLIYFQLMGALAPSIGKFVAARQRSGRPVTVVNTREAFREKIKSYVDR